jgi:hypothetical protein
MTSASLRAFDELSAATGEALWPDTVIIGGTTYACAVVPPRESTILSGFSDDPAAVVLTVRLRKATLATPPEENTLLTWSAKPWKIRSIRGHAAADAAWIINCEPAP